MIPYTDMHCDTLMRAYVSQRKNVYDMPEYMLDVKRLQKGGALAQFFAIFMFPESARTDLGDAFPKDGEYIKALLEIHKNTMKMYEEIIGGVSTTSDYRANKKAGKISGILSLEDGRIVDNKLDNLAWLFEEGIRMIALTWNHENCFGFPNSGDRSVMEKGLKPFGKESIEVMNDLGLIIDVSHLSDGGFWDIVKLSKKPFVASHSNCRAIAPHQRNLTDEMIRALAEKGGVMGLNFCGPFLNEDAESREASILLMVKHLRHMVRIGGYEVAGIGTDFDGIQNVPEIADCSGMQLLFDAMAREGFTSTQIEKIAYKNVERVMQDVWK